MYTYKKETKGWSVYKDGKYIGTAYYATTKQQALIAVLAE